MLELIKEDLVRIGVVFDEFFSEAFLYQKGEVESALNALKKHGSVFESDGALWFHSTQFGDDKDRVLKRKNGEYTYFAADIAYHATKFNRGYDLIVNLWGPDHHGYIPRVQAACEALGFSRDRVKILIVQLTTLYQGGEPVRMSKRAGEFVTLKDLVEEVGPDAARFFFLMRRVESHFEFDMDLAKKKSEENPVYYLQYAHARICSILRFANKAVKVEADTSLLKTKEEIVLLRKLDLFPRVLEQAAQSFEPYRVVDYLRELATSFHQFYAVCRVVSEDDAMTEARLLLTDSVRIVFRNGLRILGISQPESM